MVFQEGIDDLKKITWKLLVKILHSSAFSSLRKSHETFNFLGTELVLCQEDLRNQQGQVKELSLRICCQEQKHLFKLDFITPFTKSRSPF